jgi:hypothetical protein
LDNRETGIPVTVDSNGHLPSEVDVAYRNRLDYLAAKTHLPSFAMLVPVPEKAEI